MKEKLEKELEEIQRKIFMIDMIDVWSSEDGRIHSQLRKRESEIEQELKLLRETELKAVVVCKGEELLNELEKGEQYVRSL